MRALFVFALLLLLVFPAAAQPMQKFDEASCLKLAELSDTKRRPEQRTEELKTNLGICIGMLTCDKAHYLLEHDDGTLDSGDTDSEYFRWLIKTCKG